MYESNTQFCHTIPSTHVCHNSTTHTKYLTSSEAVTFTIIRSKTDQTAHGHTITLHATGGSYAQSELSLL